jgi:hypothetical protein
LSHLDVPDFSFQGLRRASEGHRRCSDENEKSESKMPLVHGNVLVNFTRHSGSNPDSRRPKAMGCKHTTTIVAKPHPKSAWQLQRSLAGGEFGAGSGVRVSRIARPGCSL